MIDQKPCEGKRCASHANQLVAGSNMKKSKWLCSPCAEKLLVELKGKNNG